MAAPRASAPLLRSMMMMSRPSSSTALHRATASQRYLSTSKPLFNTTAALPVSKPVGAFRGGLFGFLFGSAVAGASVYYYILEEYRVSNEMLTEDIYVRYCI
ncbi:hypothetical protein AJ80_08494 [Polytolypa hystricis UAMH7299]|uniref:Uncharacterized protein n=1 Tax=Polytolypa hystricis (strain UAMH7299) TaxID=1447883 RepID=A0A2B7X708_POLH7|nr:hypothetical protein AJ80_08494 [Polytolypa hystricis UAMH7299]